MTFTVGTMKDNHGGRVIGYKIGSPSKFGGMRIHFAIHGGEWARQACEELATAMTAEAAAVETPGHAEAARTVSKLRADIIRRVEADAAANRARKAAKVA